MPAGEMGSPGMGQSQIKGRWCWVCRALWLGCALRNSATVTTNACVELQQRVLHVLNVGG